VCLPHVQVHPWSELSVQRLPLGVLRPAHCFFDQFYRSSRELARSAEDVPSRHFLLNLAAILAQRAASFSSYHRSLLPHESLLVYTFVQVAHGGLQF
jgi:hypothetical protein